MPAYDAQELQIVGGPAWFATDRFSVRVHRETREGPAYILTIAKNGSKLKQSEHTQSRNIRASGNSIQIEGVQLLQMTQLLSGVLGRLWIAPVFRELITPRSCGAMRRLSTAVSSARQRRAAPDAEHESIFSAIQDQLGLSLVSQRAPIDTFVIDSIDPPSSN